MQRCKILDTSLACEQDAVAGAQQRVLVRRQLLRPVAAIDALLVKTDE